MSRTMLFTVLGLMLVIGGTCLYFIPSGTQESSIQGNQDSLTVLAWNDASYSFGSSKWMFLYEPSFGSSYESDMVFPFPFFPINPGESLRLSGKPILVMAIATSSQKEMTGTLLNATFGTSYNWNGLEVTVSKASPAYVMLSFKPLPQISVALMCS
jgi:hypothetical protein